MKLKHLMMVLIAALMLACTSTPESLLKDYEKACENGDITKAAKIANKMKNEYPNDEDWTDEQEERFLEATKVLQDKSEDAFGF